MLYLSEFLFQGLDFVCAGLVLLLRLLQLLHLGTQPRVSLNLIRKVEASIGGQI